MNRRVLLNRRVLSWQIGLLLAAAAPASIALPAATATSPGSSASADAAAQAEPEPQTRKKPHPLATTTLAPVVVTAERREQNLQDVPVAVTAISSEEINRRGLDNVNNLSALAPGLMLENNVISSGPTIGMRGTFNNDPSLFIDSPLAIYVDGVYYGKNAGAVFDLIDLERIEVLRGPQGTLYGRNAYAGAINFITHKPSGIFNGRAQVDLGNYNARVAKVALDLPAMGKLKASVGGNIVRRDGWFKTTPGSSVSQMNNAHSESSFIDLLLDATPNLSFNYRFDHHDIDQDPNFGQVINSDIQQFFGVAGIVAHHGRQTRGGVDAPVADRMKMDGQSFTATWKLGDNNTLRYIYGHRSMDRVQNLDLDGTAIPFAVAWQNNRYLMISNELQWLGKSGPVDWVAGLNHFNDSGFTNDPQEYFFGLAHTDLYYGFGTTSKAAYGQLNYHPTDRLTLTIGARRTTDHKTAYEFQAGAGVSVNFNGKTSDSATTPMASISYKLSPDVMVYGRYAEGFKGGGFNGQATSQEAASTPYGPEKKKSYELGVKSTLLGGKLRLNGDIFYERNSDLQQTVAFSGVSGTTGTNIEMSHPRGGSGSHRALAPGPGSALGAPLCLPRRRPPGGAPHPGGHGPALAGPGGRRRPGPSGPRGHRPGAPGGLAGRRQPRRIARRPGVARLPYGGGGAGRGRLGGLADRPGRGAARRAAAHRRCQGMDRPGAPASLPGPVPPGGTGTGHRGAVRLRPGGIPS